MINSFFKLIIAIGVSALAGFFGAIFTSPSISSGWYAALQKPLLNPPSWVFGPAWTILYLLMGISLYLIWKNDWKVINPILAHSSGINRKKAWNPWSERLWLGDLQKFNVIAIFGLQLVLNALWSLIFFGLQNPGLAFFEILALWMTILYTIVNFYRISKLASYLLLPYIIWVSFAVYLNYSIWMLN